MDPSYARLYRELYERHWWWRARERWLESRLEGHLGARGTQRLKILDVGSGDALAFPLLERFGEPFGIEPDLSLLSPESSYPERIFAGSLLEHPDASPSFDLVLAMDVLEHFEDDRAALDAIRERLKPGGLLMLNVPAFSALWTRHDELNRHFRRYSPAEIRERIESTGFEILELSSLFLFVVPAKWFLSRLERLLLRLRIHSRVRSETIPPAWINQLLFRWACLENRLASAIGLKLGSSIFLVARKKAMRGVF